jgi:hypothetical protein
VLTEVAGALVRAVLVMIMVATPSVLLPGTGSDVKQAVALVALFGGVLTFVEYRTAYPGLVEFRDAPPYNRTRFLMLFLMLSVLALTVRPGNDASSARALIAAMAHLSGVALDFPYSPVRLLTLMLAGETNPVLLGQARAAAGAAYMIAIMSVVAFALVLRLHDWPSRSGSFNVWVNLPTFDPTAGGDVVTRLERDARANLAFGFLLPFVIPAVIKLSGMGLGAISLASPQSLVWTITAWAFLPASLFMRGIAMIRIAEMIRERRRQEDGTVATGLAPV